MSKVMVERWIERAKELAGESAATAQAQAMQAALRGGVEIIAAQAEEIERLRQERKLVTTSITTATTQAKELAEYVAKLRRAVSE